jgi:EAL domain-containing protein (putative c-di-GMP-specific phosphodiesterase class I)/DNA-binding NarL/FixJ family response regulator
MTSSTIPATGATDATVAPDTADDAATRPLILVAEDDPVHRIALTRVLERNGFDVIAAEDGSGAIALADTATVDLLIVDAMMPHVSGFEAIAAIRSRPACSTTPAIVVSGLEDLESRINAYAIGADDFIVKPFDSRELLARVRARLRSADVWHRRVDSMIGNFRSIRRRISDSERFATPSEAVRALVPHLPDELGCSRMIMVDRAGRIEWSSDSIPPENFAGVDLHGVPTGTGANVLAVNAANICPLCGAMQGGSVLALDAGVWSTGRAILLVGCTRRADAGLRAIATEVAEACGVVLSERMRDWESGLELDSWLTTVIDDEAFDVVFQPIVEMKTGRVVAQEALARFDDGTAPGEVFRAAVTLDRRLDLELALVRTALDRAVALPEGVRVHVNVSPATALTTELGDLVSRTSRRVVLEITEDALFSASNAEALRRSIPASCLLAADDVGAGYSGMAQLLELRPDIVKIDRAVVRGIDRDPARQALVAGLVQYAQATRSFVVGEGIECQEEWESLRGLGVDFGQGHLFARPAPLAEAAQMVRFDHRPEMQPRRSMRHLAGT